MLTLKLITVFKLCWLSKHRVTDLNLLTDCKLSWLNLEFCRNHLQIVKDILSIYLEYIFIKCIRKIIYDFLKTEFFIVIYKYHYGESWRRSGNTYPKRTITVHQSITRNKEHHYGAEPSFHRSASVCKPALVLVRAYITPIRV